MTRLLALAAVSALLAGAAWSGAAAADETVATAASADAHPPAAEAAGPAPQTLAADRARQGGGDVLMTACGPEPVDDRGVVAYNPHGEISVGAGTHGYREVGGTVCQPLPGGGFVAVTAGQSRFGR
jgi:hypothetical protein